ncbi:DNA-binding protein [Clostridium aestuarii]|uniref:DNA-binding protein n=1 Tax=Clostridium aestuarii TaxID=338193 RepID=A0ABT4D3S3_9CLOT|nr:PPC domain-containing DNA-binding protein [Clostridium aestuarii]MCY6484688.1 DNA-binding protein [Clostridium aestuarii]
MKTYAVRLTTGQDLKKELINFTKENNINAGCILTCVGCITRATLRMANASIIKDFEKNYEIVSLVGTLCKDGIHLHISLSDEKGNVIGGHLKENCLIGTTAEIIIADLDHLKFTREFDKKTGYKELHISK